MTLPVLAGATGFLCLVLLVALARWRRRAKLIGQRVDLARQRAFHRHTERMATQINEPDF
ncbi:GlyGly-CTERM sorting domain-containing protein [Variovorax ureilyticus]|uniref:GlyGly-CTERM sorting domain-containing protein n=1 Tax=Variovorax ureilyticus TaxID=1836198 RepID=A0ABU8VQF4_9BURK